MHHHHEAPHLCRKTQTTPSQHNMCVLRAVQQDKRTVSKPGARIAITAARTACSMHRLQHASPARWRGSRAACAGAGSTMVSARSCVLPASCLLLLLLAQHTEPPHPSTHLPNSSKLMVPLPVLSWIRMMDATVARLKFRLPSCSAACSSSGVSSPLPSRSSASNHCSAAAAAGRQRGSVGAAAVVAAAAARQRQFQRGAACMC